jgi:hypothetical protein
MVESSNREASYPSAQYRSEYSISAAHLRWRILGVPESFKNDYYIEQSRSQSSLTDWKIHYRSASRIAHTRRPGVWVRMGF